MSVEEQICLPVNSAISERNGQDLRVQAQFFREEGRHGLDVTQHGFYIFQNNCK